LTPPNGLNLPEECILEGAEELGTMPFVIIGDEAFPLQKHVMRPYPGRKATLAQDAYNYRHSRARRIVECAFGILAARWRVFHTRIAVLPSTVNLIVQSTTILHNMLQKETTPAFAADPIGETQRQEVTGLESLRRLPTRGTTEAVDIRDKFTKYFVDHPLPWQESYIQRGLHD
jgi:hypothetical protein